MREPLRTLIIEDSEDDTELVVYELRKAGYEVTYERVDTPDALITALESKSWDIILSDHSMPGFSGTSALKFVRERAGDIPFIVVSGSISEDAAVAMMKAGAHDYFYKGNIARLVPAVQRELNEAHERMQREWAEKQLREAEERLAKVFRVSPSAIAISTLAEGVFIDVNSSFLELTGYQRAEVVGRSSLDIQLWGDTDKREALLRRVRDETTVRDFVTSFRLKSGEVRDVLLSCEKLEFGGVDCILSVFFDVTERNRATEAIRRYSERLRTLHSIDQSILAARSPVEVAQAVLGSLHSLLPCSHAAVVAHDAERQTASIVAVYSRDATALQPGKAIALPGGDQPLSKTLAESDTLPLSDLERLLYAEGVRDYSYFPLSARGRIIGSLVVGSERQSASPEEIEIVHELGAQLAVAWENARLSSTVLRQVQALDTLRRASLQLTSSLDLQIILDTVLDYATELVNSDSAHIFLYRDDQLIFGAAFFDGAHQRQPYAIPRMDGITSMVARTGEMVVIPDVNADPLYGGWQWGGAILGLPLRMGDEINGVLTLAYTQPHTFDDDTVRVLTLLADHAALAVHNAQLYARIQQHAGELEAHVAARTEELQLAKEHVEAVLDNSSDTIIVLNTDGTIQQTNPAFRELFGYGDEVVGKPFAALAKPDFAEVLNVVFGAVVETRAPQRAESVFLRKDGTEFNADFALSAIANERLRGVVCNLRDITARKLIEEELRKALAQEKELSELKLRFNSMVSHEFRTPLAVILSSSEMLQNYYQRMSDERRDQHLNRVQIQVRRLISLLDDFLMINKADLMGVQYIPEPVDVRDLCRDIVEEFQMIAESYRLEYVAPEGCPTLSLDVKLMRQAISNLLSNAVKYSPAGGTIRLQVACEPDALRIQVSDQGIGIPEEDQKRLFEVFHRAGNVGTVPGMGLGLVITKRAVEVHGGTVTFASKVGEGTTFIITIPMENPEPS